MKEKLWPEKTLLYERSRLEMTSSWIIEIVQNAALSWEKNILRFYNQDWVLRAIPFTCVKGGGREKIRPPHAPYFSLKKKMQELTYSVQTISTPRDPLIKCSLHVCLSHCLHLVNGFLGRVWVTSDISLRAGMSVVKMQELTYTRQTISTPRAPLIKSTFHVCLSHSREPMFRKMSFQDLLVIGFAHGHSSPITAHSQKKGY